MIKEGLKILVSYDSDSRAEGLKSFFSGLKSDGTIDDFVLWRVKEGRLMMKSAMGQNWCRFGIIEVEAGWMVPGMIEAKHLPADIIGVVNENKAGSIGMFMPQLKANNIPIVTHPEAEAIEETYRRVTELMMFTLKFSK